MLNQRVIFPGHLVNIALVGKTEIAIIADDNMFMNSHAHDPARKYQLPCYGDIFRGWMGISRRMIMGEDDCCGMMIQGSMYDFSGIYAAGRQRVSVEITRFLESI